MAVVWGAWRYSGGNGMRVGIDLSWSNVNHGSNSVTATVTYWTQNQFGYGDDQHLNFSGAIGGGHNFYNGAGGDAVLRETRTFTYNYGSNEYGSSPGSRTFGVSLSGAYNGVTPSRSITRSIPARPIGGALAPGNANASYINDSSTRFTWNNNSTSARPWSNVTVDREVWGGNGWYRVANLGGGASAWTDNNTTANRAYRYRVRASNSAGTSGWATSGWVRTTPAAPSNVSRSGGNGGDQVITWNDNTNLGSLYEQEVQRRVDGVWELAATVNNGVTSWTDLNTSAVEKLAYRVRAHLTAYTNRYSSWSGVTSETTGATAPPDSPDNLIPDEVALNPNGNITISWDFNASIAGDSQSGYDIEYRVSGTTTWTTVSNLSRTVSSHTFGAGTFPDGENIEYRVRTYGADPTPSSWSAPASFQSNSDPLAESRLRAPVYIDLITGRLQGRTADNARIAMATRAPQIIAAGQGVSRSWLPSNDALSWSGAYSMGSLGMGEPLTSPGNELTVPFPPDGTVIPGYGGAANRTVSGGEIVLYDGEALWFEPDYKNYTDNTQYRVVGSTLDFIPPIMWILVAQRSANQLFWGSGKLHVEASYCKRYRTTKLAISNSTWSRIPFGTVVSSNTWDLNWNSTNNSIQLATNALAGNFFAKSTARWEFAPDGFTGQMRAEMTKEDSINSNKVMIDTHGIAPNGTKTVGVTLSCSGSIWMEPGDQVSMQVYQNSGGPVSLDPGNFGEGWLYLDIFRLPTT